MRYNRLVTLIACALAGPVLAASPIIDVKPGTPVPDLLAGRDAARQLRAAGEHGPIVVRLADGAYGLPQPVVFEPQDGNVSYEAAPGAHPVLVGGRKIAGFKAGADGIWTTQVPGVHEGQWYFEALWVNGNRATRARTPNDGFIQGIDQPAKPVAGIPFDGDAGHTLLMVPPNDAAALRGLSPAELHDVNVVAYHTWDVNRHRVAGVRPEDGTLQFTGGGAYPFFKPEPSQRVHFENFRGALDAPGEWFLDRNGTLSYIPRPGETPEAAEVWAPVAPRWLVFRGDPAKQELVKDLHFRGLAFRFQSYELPEKGACFGQAERDAGAAIEADGADGVSFENCEFAHTLTNAAWFRRGCHNVTLRHCWLHDLGAGGVKIGEPTVSDAGPQQSDHVTLEDCIIHGGGRYFIGAIGATIFHAHDCTIRHCDIADFFYTAVSIGWTWGYHPTACANNIVEDCHLHHLGWGILSDMGAVYTLGPLPGTVIRGCNIHDIAAATYGGWGMYNDEGSTGVLWENNLVHHTQDAGYHMHYGRGDIVRNNIFADCANDAHIRHSRPEEYFAFAFEHNIVLLGTARLFGQANGNWQDGRVDLHDNIYWKPGGVIKNFAGKSWSQWQAMGCDTNSLVADPLFVNPAAGDWTLRPESPALQRGFVPFNWRQAGVSGDEAWRKLAAEEYPPMKFQVPPADLPLTLHEGFETTPLGGKPAHVWQGVKDPSTIVVVAEHPAAGQRCLQLTDGPEIQPGWDPHFFYSPHHDHGTTHFAFDVRLEPDYQLWVEWRDDASPYHTGPALHLEHGVLTAGDRKVGTIPPQTWAHVEMSAKLGPASDGTFAVTLTVPGTPPQHVEGLKFGTPEFQTLDWLGFISPGNVKCRCWLDNIDIENTEITQSK